MPWTHPDHQATGHRPVPKRTGSKHDLRSPVAPPSNEPANSLRDGSKAVERAAQTDGAHSTARTKAQAITRVGHCRVLAASAAWLCRSPAEPPPKKRGSRARSLLQLRSTSRRVAERSQPAGRWRVGNHCPRASGSGGPAQSVHSGPASTAYVCAPNASPALGRRGGQHGPWNRRPGRRGRGSDT